MDDPVPITRGVRVPLRDITVRTMRSSGPGGQHANVTASRVEASLDLRTTRCLDAVQRRRAIERVGPVVRGVAQDARSQARNRDLAVERLAEKLRGALHVDPPRRPTRPTAGSKRRRIEAKGRRAGIKRDRRSPGMDG